MSSIAIVIIAYNRINSLNQLLFSLNRAYYPNENITLIISIDKSEKNDVGNLVDSFEWKFGDKRVIKHNEKLGLKKHVLKCGDFLNEFEAIVVLEDDIIISPSFYTYSIDTVSKYQNNMDIAGISLYNFNVNFLTYMPFYPIKNEFDVYFMNIAQSWGQIWLKKQWEEFIEWYKINDVFPKETDHLPQSICKWPESSWLKHHIRYCIEKDKYFVYPQVSLSTNSGETGTHNNDPSVLFSVITQSGNKNNYLLPQDIQLSEQYDGFFENRKLRYHLSVLIGIDENDICIDLNNEKKNREKKRFWLTTSINEYKVIYSFGLKHKPIEMNIINDITGNDIFLYDTFVGNGKLKNLNSVLLKYNFKIYDMIWLLKMYTFKNLIIDIYNRTRLRFKI